jgi:predicted HD phosphohydrolase
MFERTALFCERYDQNSFDPNYDTLPVAAFMPMVRRILARAPFGTSNGIAPSGAAA